MVPSPHPLPKSHRTIGGIAGCNKLSDSESESCHWLRTRSNYQPWAVCKRPILDPIIHQSFDLWSIFCQCFMSLATGLKKTIRIDLQDDLSQTPRLGRGGCKINSQSCLIGWILIGWLSIANAWVWRFSFHRIECDVCELTDDLSQTPRSGRGGCKISSQSRWIGWTLFD